MKKMMRRAILIALMFVLCPVARGAEPATTDEARLAWWREARFGMFIHWGPSSLTGREVSWSRKMPRPGCGHPEWGTLPIEMYDHLYLIFNPVDFDADRIVQTAQAAGMKYLVFTTKHHDGFCNFDADNTDYKITSAASPFRRDLVKELADACHRHGLRLGFYYSQPDWRHPDYLTDNHDRYIRYFHEHIVNLLSNYGKVDIIWFDGLGLGPDQWGAQDLFRKMRQLQPDILINNRCGLPGDFDTPEQQVGAYQDDRPWESCITIGDQWSWKPHDRIKSLRQCIRTLVNCAGGDGNLLFNVGPTPLGVIEPEQVERLEQMGDWLVQYGQTVYGTRGGPYLPGDYGVSTRRDNRIFIHVLDWEADPLRLPAPPARIVNAYLLTGGPVDLRRADDKIEIRVAPAQRRDIDTIVVLELDRPAAELAPISTLPPSLATGKPATASDFIPGYEPGRAVDTAGNTRWATPGGTHAAWIEIDLGAPQTVNRVRVNEEIGHRTQQYRLLGWADGRWITLAEGQHLGHGADLRFDPVTISRVKLDILRAVEGPTISSIFVHAPPQD